MIECSPEKNKSKFLSRESEPLKKPVLIIGYPRSGTNYLTTLLSLNSSVSSLTEPYSLHTTFFVGTDGEVWTEDDKSVAEIIKQHPELSEIFETIGDFLKPSRGEVHLVKETTFLMKLRWLRRYLGDVKIIFLIRDPYEVLASHSSNSLYEKWNIEHRFQAVAEQVKTNLKEYKTLLDRVNLKSIISKMTFLWIVENFEAMRHLHLFEHEIVRYEDLENSTESTVQKLTSFMGLECEDKQIKFIEESQQETRGDMYSSFRSKQKKKNQNGVRLTHEEIEEVASLLSVAREVALHLGIDYDYYFNYQMPNPAEVSGGLKTDQQISRVVEQKFSPENCALSKESLLASLLENPILFRETAFARFQITNEEFASFLNEAHIQNEKGFSYLYINTFAEKCRIRHIHGIYQVQEGYGNHPCVYVNWYGAHAFCEWLGVNLPSEEVMDPIIAELTTANPDIGSLNIGEVVGTTVPVDEMTHENQLLNLFGNTWRWLDAPKDGEMTKKYGGAYNSSKYAWDSIFGRHKRFGASSIGFQVVIPQQFLK